MHVSSSSSYRALPSVDRLLAEVRARGLDGDGPHGAIVAAAREALQRARETIAAGGPAPDLDALAASVVENLAEVRRVRLRPVVNATGVIVHTNLGRAPLAADAVRAMAEVAGHYSNLEFDLESGGRGSRQAVVQDLLCQLTGAEAALVVNNNASAVLLALTALAGPDPRRGVGAGREVIVSRGQAVEIGGGFRIPDVLRQSGARLIEVGTTNRTYLEDYADAIGEETAALLRVHPSNFRIQGFTHDVSIADLARLAHERGIVAIDDLGSGALLDTTAYGLAHEPMPQESIAAGCDVVCFSGDKLLGGPQAGIIVGRAAAIRQLQRHPLARAVRIDKASLVGLEATLRHYALGTAVREIPVWRMIATTVSELEARVHRWKRELAKAGISASIVEAESTVGGGSLPGETLPSRALALGPNDATASAGGTASTQALPEPHELARRLRSTQPPVIGRIERGRLLLDPRTVLPDEDAALIAAILSVLRSA